MDVIRTILLAHEAEDRRAYPYHLPDYNEHVRLIGEADLATVSIIMGADAIVHRLTSNGRDFVDLARDDERWERVKKRIGKVGGAPFDIWLDLLRHDVLGHV